MLDNKVYIVFLAEILKMRAKFYTTQGDDATKIRPDWNATNDTSTCFFFFFPPKATVSSSRGAESCAVRNFLVEVYYVPLDRRALATVSLNRV